MRYLIVLLLCVRGFATISIATGYPIGGQTNCSSSTTTSCNSPTLTSTTAKALLIVEIATNVSSGTGITAGPTDSQGDVFIGPTGCSVTTTGNSVSCYYCLNAVGGTTSITASVTTGVGRGMGVMEFTSSIAGVVWSLDSSGSAIIAGPQTNPPGIALTLTGGNDVIMQGVVDLVTAISGSYTGLTNFGGGGRSFAYAVNTTVGTAPTWTAVSSSNMVFNAIAFMESPQFRRKFTERKNCDEKIIVVLRFCLCSKLCSMHSC